MIRAAEKNVDMCPAFCCVAAGEGDTAVVRFKHYLLL